MQNIQPFMKLQINKLGINEKKILLFSLNLVFKLV